MRFLAELAIFPPKVAPEFEVGDGTEDRGAADGDDDEGYHEDGLVQEGKGFP